jgi:hypothetical protein
LQFNRRERQRFAVRPDVVRARLEHFVVQFHLRIELAVDVRGLQIPQQIACLSNRQPSPPGDRLEQAPSE